MSQELDSALTQPDRHPFKTKWEVEGGLDTVLLRFFWEVSISPEVKRRFEQVLSDRADQLIEENWMHYLHDKYKWRMRSRRKGVPATVPLAHKVEVWGDFETIRELADDQLSEPVHRLLDALNNFQPPINLVKVEMG